MAGITAKHFNILTDFKCAAGNCEDHCCGSWRVSVNDATKKLYADKAPELLEYISDDEDGSKIDNSSTTGNCSQFDEDHLCKIHRDYGEKFLPDTCDFYPRIVRQLGKQLVVSATSSCPEVMRLAMSMEDPFKLVNRTLKVLPEHIADFKMDEEIEDEIIYVIERFSQETLRKDISAADVMMRILVVSKMIDSYRPESWGKIIDKLFEMADFYQVEHESAEKSVSNFDIVQFLAELRAFRPPRWVNLFASIEPLFNVRFLTESPAAEVHAQRDKIRIYQDNENVFMKIDHALKRYVGCEIVRTLFPYAGKSGDTTFEKAVIMGVHMAFLRVALIASIGENGEPPSDERIVTVAQTLSRGTNHLSRDVVDFYKGKNVTNPGRMHQIVYMY